MKKLFLIPIIITILLMLCGCETSAAPQQDSDVKTVFLFELFTTNNHNRYQELNKRTAEANQAFLKAREGSDLGMAGIDHNEIINDYYSKLRPVVTDRCYDSLLQSTTMWSIDRICDEAGVSLVPISVEFTSTGTGPNDGDEYFDYELVVNIVSESSEEEYVIKGTIAEKVSSDSILISAHEYFNFPEF